MRKLPPRTTLVAVLALTATHLAAQTTLSPPVLLDDLAPGLDTGSSNPRQFLPMGDRTVFLADQTVGTSQQRGLWVSTGQAQGTTLLTPVTGSVPTFGCRIRSTGVLWTEGHRLEHHDVTGQVDQNLGAEAFALPFPGLERPTVVFCGRGAGTGKELWITDGTPGGTRLLVDLEPGSTSSDPRDLVQVDWPDGRGGTRDLTFFTAETSAAGRELWVTEGSAASTRMVADFVPGRAGGFDLGSNGTELVAWTDPRTLNLFLVCVATDPRTGKELARFELSNRTGLFRPLPMNEIRPGAAGSDPVELTALGDRVVLTATSPTGGREIHVQPFQTDQALLLDLDNAPTSTHPGTCSQAPSPASQGRPWRSAPANPAPATSSTRPTARRSG